jgi:hypothetical protein
VIDIENLDHAGLQEHRLSVEARLRQLERDALLTLQHRPLTFGWRLIKAALGIKIQSASVTQPDTLMAL